MQNDWQIKNLGDVCIFENGDRGKNYPSRSSFVNSGIPFVNAGHLKYGRIDNSGLNFITQDTFDSLSRGKFHKGDLLFCLRGSLGKFALIQDDTLGAIASSLVIVRPLSSVLGEFLAYYFQSDFCTKMILEFAGGAAQPNLGAKDLAKFRIPIPPLPEQRRLVVLLDELLEKLEKANRNTKKSYHNSKDLFTSYLSGIFTNSGKDWEKKKLGDIGKVSMCKRVFKNQTAKIGDIPFYKIGTFGKNPDAYISHRIYDEFRKKFSFPKKGDILISASGTIGRRVKYDGKPAYFQDSNIVWIDNDENQVLNDYLYQFYGACNWNSTKGATISRLYNDNLRQIEISFPKSISKQKSIVAHLEDLTSATETLKSNYKQKLANFEELKQSILHQAFTGKL